MAKVPQEVEALLQALRFRNADQGLLRSLDDRKWAALLSYCDLMRLTLVLERVGDDSLPTWVRTRLTRNLADNHERFARMKVAYIEIASALQEVGIEHLVLKGFAQWPDSMDPRGRMQGDLDLYIPNDSVMVGQQALRRIGYEPLRGFDHSPSDHLPAMTRQNHWKWRGDYFDPDIPLSIDLHFRFWDEGHAGFGPQGLAEFWSRRVHRQFEDLSFPSLHTTDSLAYGSLHALRHMLHGTMSVSNIYEIAWFLHRYQNDSQFWNNWCESHDRSLRQLEAVCFRLAREWFDCALPEEAQVEIEALPAEVDRWIETYGRSPLCIPFRPNKDALWLHLSLAEPARKTAIFFKALFPSRFPTIEAVEEQRAKLKDPPSKPSVPYTYIGHLARRTLHHARILPQTLWHGAGWWWSSKELGGEFLAFLGASFFYTLGMFIYFFLFNLFLLDLGYKEKFVGLSTGALAIGGIAGILPAGLLAQRFGIRKALVTCFTLVPAILIARALMTWEVSQIALAFCTGALAAIWGVTISPALAQLTTEKNRPFGFSVVFASGIGVGVLGGLIGGHLPGWLAQVDSSGTNAQLKQVALLISCGIILLAVWPVSRLRFASAPPPEKHFYRSNPFLLRYLPAIAIWSLATGAFTPFFNVYFSQHLRVPVEKIGLYFSGAQLFQVVAILLAPIIFQKCGIILGIVYMQIATALSLGCLASVHAASAAGLVYACYAAFQWMSEPGMYSLLMNQVKPSERSGASAMNALVIASSQAIAAVVAGAALARFGYTVVLQGVALTALVAALTFRILLSKAVPSSARSAAVLRPATESSSAID
jgi:MFS family permease